MNEEVDDGVDWPWFAEVAATWPPVLCSIIEFIENGFVDWWVESLKFVLANGWFW